MRIGYPPCFWRRHASRARSAAQRSNCTLIWSSSVMKGRTGAWRADRHRAEQTAGRGTYVPVVFQPGEAFQFDRSEDWANIGGERVKLQVVHIKLSHGRAFLVHAYPLQTHGMLFDGHRHAFRAFGGVPDRGIYDNMKTAVLCAADLAPEAGVPTKTHIRNLLHRLPDRKQTDLPAGGPPDALALETASKANVDRYDDLRQAGEKRHAS